jgi:fructose-1,6-bisphosphatase/inositol monophosphatase family enzyme
VAIGDPEGGIHATIMLSNNPWDNAAGVVIAREAERRWSISTAARTA